MHARHRNPGNGYRSSSMGMGGVPASSRISPESSMRGHGMYNSEYRSYNRGFGRGRPKPFQAVQPPPPPRTDIFMEAGRLATEYLVSKGLLPPNVLSGKWQNGSLKNQVGDFQGFRQQGDSLHLPQEGRTSALARLGNAADAGLGRRRFADEYNPTGPRNNMQVRRRMGSFKNYGSNSDWGREMGRSQSYSDKARACPDMEDNDSFSGYQEDKQVGNDVVSGGQRSCSSELAPKSDGAGDSESVLEKSLFQDDTSTNTSPNIEKDLLPETEVEPTKRSDDTKLLKEETVGLQDGTSNDQVEKQSDTENARIQHCAMEVDSINKNGGDLLSLCRFAKVPTKTRSSLTTRVDASSNQIQSSKCLDSDIPKETPVMSAEDVGELGPMYTEQGKCVRSQSFPDISFMNEQESSEGPPGFGRCSSMIMERVTQTDDFFHLSHLRGKQPISQEGRRSPCEEAILTMDQERPTNMSQFQRRGAGPCIEYAEEKQFFPGSFKICDLNLVEASEVNENPDPDSILIFPSIPEIKKEATPVDVDLSISNNCNISGKYGRCGADGKEIEVIDLENDSVQEDKAFNNSERKAETVFTGLENFPNHACANDISDVQDGYGLIFSDLLGPDISNCSSVPAGINSLHNEMALHDGEDILGDDESIYMSLGEIPISMPEI
ncbi:hypothetical protein HYC85_014904 [Camellia sinensis]|uniref:Uncharacterized protein n=1 Tax=Camellia sinensis TaxID=4442 RepID=A0A7J7H8Q6_CAMSI|nr:hypothetical protein HYC85_014904 [Camellia sinensis]